MPHPRPTRRSKRMRVELRTDSRVALEGAPGRQEEAAEDEGDLRNNDRFPKEFGGCLGK